MPTTIVTGIEMHDALRHYAVLTGLNNTLYHKDILFDTIVLLLYNLLDIELLFMAYKH